MATVETEETQVLVLPSRQKTTRLEKNALARRDEAKTIKVTSAAKYNEAAVFVLEIKGMEKTVEELYDQHVKDAHTLHKNLTTARGKLLSPLSEARKLVESSMSAWTLEQNRIAQQKAQADAEAERQRELKEAKKIKDAAERKEVIEELKATPVVAESVEIAVPRVSGISARKVVKFKVFDARKVPRQFLIVDESAIRAYVKLHGLEAKIGGVEVYEDVQTQIRA